MSSRYHVSLAVWNLITEKKCVLSEAFAMVSTWIAESIDWLVDNSSVASANRSSSSIPSQNAYRPVCLSDASNRDYSWSDGRAHKLGVEKPRENEASARRHERGRLSGDREDVRAGRTSAATLREAAEGPGASAGLRDAAGCCALLGHGASHHATRRIFATGLQKGLSRWALSLFARREQKRRGKVSFLNWDKKISRWIISQYESERSKRDRYKLESPAIDAAYIFVCWSVDNEV